LFHISFLQINAQKWLVQIRNLFNLSKIIPKKLGKKIKNQQIKLTISTSKNT